MTKTALDAADIRILSALQRNGPLSKTRLAELVNLSPTPCRERVSRLTRAGLIRGYRAEIALDRLGEITTVIVTVSLTTHRAADFARFERRIADTDAIVECLATGGGMDYVLKIVTRRLSDFQALMEALLAEDLGIGRYMTYIVTRQVKSEPPDIARLADPRDG
ncbi:Lrp/AsnC family transcriptional regulator [Roseovarius salinarum]|uniref:Lrp/AsnC family transcriptional regulator n=1 Tax=Roseovarius salinarum TaxID=1981892 RepID=UPI000C32B056|nr:Lrp/AsnC family transcriptional regulator [Roseovarius salinarum]